MRIAFVGPFGLSRKGTMAVRALPLARALARRGHCVRVALPPWDSPEDAGRAWHDRGVQLSNVSLPPPVPLYRHLSLARRVLGDALREEPEIVHCFKPKAYSGLAAMGLWYSRAGPRRPRLVVDSDDWEGSGGWNDLEAYTWPQKRLFAFQERWGLAHCHRLTVASRALATLARGLGAPPSRVSYLPNGADLPAGTSPEAVDEARRRYGLQGRKVLLLYTRFFEFDPSFPAEVLRRVAASEPEARLLVVGKGLFGEERAFLEAASGAGLGSRVVMAGWVEPAELPACFALAHAALYPYRDSLINRTKCSAKLVELMAAGVPVVASRVGQNEEYIEPGVSGYLVEPADADSMAGEALRLLREPDLRARMAAGARARVRREFTWDRLAERAEEVYLSALEEAP